jgi:hypothetical protein
MNFFRALIHSQRNQTLIRDIIIGQTNVLPMMVPCSTFRRPAHALDRSSRHMGSPDICGHQRAGLPCAHVPRGFNARMPWA